MKKKAPKQKHHDIYYGSLKFTLVISWGGTVQESIDRLCKIFKKETWESNASPNSIGHFAANTDIRGGALWFKDFKPTPALAAHEAFHAIYHLMQHVMGLPLNEATEELYAYHIEHLVDLILEGP